MAVLRLPAVRAKRMEPLLATPRLLGMRSDDLSAQICYREPTDVGRSAAAGFRSISPARESPQSKQPSAALRSRSEPLDPANLNTQRTRFRSRWYQFSNVRLWARRSIRSQRQSAWQISRIVKRSTDRDRSYARSFGQQLTSSSQPRRTELPIVGSCRCRRHSLQNPRITIIATGDERTKNRGNPHGL